MKRALFSKFFAYLSVCMVCVLGVIYIAKAAITWPTSGSFSFSGIGVDDTESAKGVMCDDKGEKNLNFFVDFSYGKIYGVGICSSTYESEPLLTGNPSSTLGQYCWCNLTGFDGTDAGGTIGLGSLTHSIFISEFSNTDECLEICGCDCANRLADDGDFRDVIYGETFQLSGSNCQLLGEISGFTSSCGKVLSTSVSSPNWTMNLASSKVLNGTSVCSSSFGTPGETGTPNVSSSGSSCWCRVTSYFDGTNTYTAGSSSWFNLGDYGNYSDCNSNCATDCSKMKPCDFEKGIFCESSGYSVTYDCNSGTGTAPTDSNGYQSGATVTAPSTAGTCALSGKHFVGWKCDTLTNTVAPGGTFTITSDTTCSAVYADFAVVTTSLTGTTFTFDLSANGSFDVNCDNGSLSGTGVSGGTITKNNTTSYTYTCTYPSNSGVHVITFNKNSVSGYNTDANTPTAALQFYQNTNVAAILGSLSSLFPAVSGTYPKFKNTFNGCSNITSIPDTLFSGYSGNISSTPSMFAGTFAGTGITSIPSTLFNGITGSSVDMFGGTFSGCDSLTTVPTGLFSSVSVGAQGMFVSTFSDCDALTTIQSGVFSSNFTSVGQNMFLEMFQNCSHLTTIPPTLFNGVTTSADMLFYETFAGCTALVEIPSGLFSGITTGASGMFMNTFSGCNHLTTVPTNLFANILTSANAMFDSTFSGCSALTGYISPTLFGGLTPRQSSYPTNMTYNTFTGTGISTSCPNGTTQYTTGYESYWGSSNGNNYVSCDTARTLTYSCGTHATGTLTDANSPYATGTTVTALPATMQGGCSPDFYYTFTGWSCDNGVGNVGSYGTFTMPAANVTCTAQWTHHTAVLYKCDTKCSAPGVNQNFLQGSSYSLANPAELCEGFITGQHPCYIGYDFTTTGPNIIGGGWRCSIGSGYLGSASGTWNYQEDTMRCEAVWTPKTTAVTYSCGAGSVKSGQSGNLSATFTYDSSYSLANVSTLCQKTGYSPASSGTHVISGWECELVNGTYLDAASGTWSSTEASMICTALWTANTYQEAVTFNCGGGNFVSNASTTMSATYDASYELPSVASKCRKTGYMPQTSGTHNVGGWVCAANEVVGGTYLGAASGTWNTTYTYTCTAQWTAYVTPVTYSCNGGSFISGQSSTGSFTYGSAYTIPNASTKCATRNGYHLVTSGTDIVAGGWKCKDRYDLGNNYITVASGTWNHEYQELECIAQWEPYKVYYNCGTAPGQSLANAPGPATPTYGSSYEVAQMDTYCTHTAGYEFGSNWACSYVNNGNTVNVSWAPRDVIMSYTINADVTCVAQYTANTYTLTYNMGNPGNGVRCAAINLPSTTATMGQSATVATNGFSCSGVNFASWRCQNTTANIDVSFSSGQVVNPWTYPANLTCAAQWTQDTTLYTVTYSCGQSGSGTPPASQSFMMNQAYTLADSPGSCVGTVGYKFNGWSCTNGLSGALNSNGTPASGSWSLTSNSTCSPSWTSASANTIDLEWTAPSSGQPGWTSSNPASCSYGSTLSVLPNAPGKDGYHFTGWSVVKNWFRTHSNYGSNDYYAKVLSGGNTICKKGTYSSSWSLSTVNCSTYATVFNTLSLYEWAALETDFYWFGTSLCSMTPSVIGQNIGSPSSTAGRFCWCKLTKHAEVIGNAIGSLETEDDMPWVHMNCLTGVAASGPGFSTTANCQASCASRCAEAAAMTASQAPWRSLYGGGTNSVTTDGTCVSGLGGL